MDKKEFLEGLLAKMSLEQKVGQCVVIGSSGSMITNDLREAITRYHCGGIRLSCFARCFRYFTDDKAVKMDMGEGFVPSKEKMVKQGVSHWISPEQYAAMLNELRQLAARRDPAIPLHMVLDQEGDTSKDMSRGGVVQFPASLGLACTGDPQLTYDASAAVAKQLKASGMDMIHSPVVDVNINPNNPEIARRAFSDDKEVVAEHAIAQVKAFKDNGIIAAAKHFPGRGDSATDAHHACPKLDVDLERLHEVELYPYKKLIEAGLDSIMIAHCIYPAIDDQISSISRKIVHDLLRVEMGFEGLITTDSMTMGALISKYGTAESCARALQAGSDIILMKAENQWRGEMFETLRNWVEDGRIDAGELDEKVLRILGMKYDYGMFDNMCIVDASKASEPYRDPEVIEVAERAAQRAIMVCKDELNALPLDNAKKILLINQQNSIKTPNDVYDHPALFQEMMEKSIPTLQTLEVDFGFNEDDEKNAVAYAEAGDYDLIICTNWYDRSQQPHTFVKELIDKGLPVVLISNEAYCIKESGGLIPSAKTAILNMNLSPQGLDMARRVLLGETEPQGKWPLTNYDPMGLRE